jgi:DNA-binding protein H-NS
VIPKFPTRSLRERFENGVTDEIERERLRNHADQLQAEIIQARHLEQFADVLKKDREARSAKPERTIPKKRELSDREKRIAEVIEAGYEGHEYAEQLEKREISPLMSWQVDGCPKTYPIALKAKRWRQRIYNEKSKIKARMPKHRHLNPSTSRG